MGTRRRLLWLCRIWYTLVGGAAVAGSIGMYLTAIASECRVSFGRMHVRSTDLNGCVQHLDTPFMVVLGIGGLLLLCAAMWVNDHAVAERSLAGVGIGVGGLAALLPAWWGFAVASYYGISQGGMLLALLIAGFLTCLGTCAAIGMTIAWTRQGGPDG